MRLFKILILFLLIQFNSAFAQEYKDIEQDISDSVITAKITAKITSRYNLNPLKISVSTNKGVVTLKGNVEKAEAFFDVVKLTKETKGVKEVDTEDLEIGHMNTAFTDAYITAKVQTQILKSKLLDDDTIPLVGINATTSNGVVTLTGSVKNQESMLILLKRISEINGVKQVVSNLIVKDDNE